VARASEQARGAWLLCRQSSDAVDTSGSGVVQQRVQSDLTWPRLVAGGSPPDDRIRRGTELEPAFASATFRVRGMGGSAVSSIAQSSYAGVGRSHGSACPIAAVGDRDEGAVARCRSLVLGRSRRAPERCCWARAAKRVARRGSVLGRLWTAAGLGLSSRSVRGLRRSVGGCLASAGSGARVASGGLLGVTASTGQGAWDCTHLRVVAPRGGIRVRCFPITISSGASS
jgi:hypothetical protein